LPEAPVVYAHLAPTAAFAAAHEDRAAAAVQIQFVDIERFLDAQVGAPENDISARARAPCSLSSEQRMTAVISSVRAGSAGKWRPRFDGRRRA
jgi:hypothetical protein